MKSKKIKFWAVMVAATALVLFIGCQTSVPVTYTAPARVNMSGIKRVGIISDSYLSSIMTWIEQTFNKAGITLGTDTEINEWRRWNQLTARQSQATEITADNLARAYAENVPRADSNYGNGKTLRVTGVVDEIDVVRGRYYVRLTGSGNDAVMIFFAASEANRVRSLDKGQTVTFIGECYGRVVPDDEDIAEILRLLGAGSRVNVVNGNFPVSNYEGALDAIITFTNTRSVMELTPVDSRGIFVTGGDPAVQVNYQIWSTRTNSMIGQGERKVTLLEGEDYGAKVRYGTSFLISEIVPTQKTTYIALAKETENMAVQEEMISAENLFKARDYTGAVEAYSRIYSTHKNFAAGYNQAVLTEVTTGIEDAIELMELLYGETNNPKARSALNDLKRRFSYY